MTLCSTFVALLVATTVDPTAAAPAGSVTNPVRLAVFIWANALVIIKAEHAIILMALTVCRNLFMIF